MWKDKLSASSQKIKEIIAQGWSGFCVTSYIFESKQWGASRQVDFLLTKEKSCGLSVYLFRPGPVVVAPQD